MSETFRGGGAIKVADLTARQDAAEAKGVADAAKAEADKNKALIEAIKKELADGDHDITDDEIRRVVAAYLDENQFGESSQPIADFFPADLSTLSATGQFDANTLSRGAVPGAGVYALWRDTDGNNHEPARYLVITNGPSPQLWFGWKMGVVAPSWKQIGGLTEIADGSITKAKLSQEVQDELNAAAARVSKHLHASSYYYLRVAAGTQPPPLPAASEFTATVGANGAFTIAYAGALGITDARPANFESAYDYWSFQYQIIASSDSDPNPGVIITQGWQQIDVKDASAVDGITEARVREIVEAAVADAGLNAAQTTAVQNLVNASIASSGHQSESEVRALIATAIAGIVHTDSTARAGVATNAAEIRQLRAANAVGLIQKIAATGAGVNAYLQLPEDFAARFNFLMVSLTEAGETRRTILSVGSDLDADTAIPLRASGSSDLRFTLATRRIENWDKNGNPDLVITSGEFFAVGQGNIKAFAQSNGRAIEYGDLAEALQARINSSGDGIPPDIARLAEDLDIEQHPEGIWERVGIVEVDRPTGFLFTNDSTTPNHINPEPFTKGGVSIDSGTRINFVRRHANPNSDDNAWPGVSPYTTGQLDIAKVANEKNLVISCIIGQMAAQRAAVGAGDATEIMFQLGNKPIMRFNQRGLELSIGQTSGGTSQTRAHFARYDSHLLPHISNTLYNNSVSNAIAGHNVAAQPRIKLTAKQRIADEQFVRRTSSVIVVPLANTAPTNFAIPIEGQQSIVGTLQYNAGNKAISYRFTSGHNVPGENFTIDFAIEISETITLPNGTVWGGMLAAESLSHPGFFQQARINEFIFAFVKVHDEADSPNNLMKMVYRINDFTDEQMLHQTRQQLQLDSASVKLATSLQNVARVQIGTYEADHPPSQADLVAMDVNVIGWNQIVRNHADDKLKFRAKLAAHSLEILAADGSTRPINEAVSWAQPGNPDVLPEGKIPASQRVPGQTVEDIVINVSNPTSVEATAQRVAFGQHDLRERDGKKLKWIAFPVQYKQGSTQAQTISNSNRPEARMILIDIDQLPTDALIPNVGDSWERTYTVAHYPGSSQKLVVRIWQARTAAQGVAGGAGVGSVWVGLYYQNWDNGYYYVSPTQRNIPGGVRNAEIGHFAFFHFGGGNTQNSIADAERAKQIRLIPKAQKGNPGDKGDKGEQGVAGPAGADGAKGEQGDAGAGVAAGGAIKQALVKKSAADFDTAWETISGFNVSENLLSSPLTIAGGVDSTKTIDLTGAKAVVVGCSFRGEDMFNSTYEIIPIARLNDSISSHIINLLGSRRVRFSFPNKTATAAAQVRLDDSIDGGIHFIGKITG